MSDLYKPKTYYIKTFGCQANEADSSTIAGILEALGFEKLPEPVGPNDAAILEQVVKNVDLFIVNTCSVRQKSEDKVYGIGKIVTKTQREANIKPFIVMAGCMVGSVTGERQRYDFDVLQKKTPWVDVYVNPSQLMEIPKVLYDNGVLSEWALNKFSPDNISLTPITPTSAFVNISFGCDNFCTFCVVPYARGQEISRPEADILREINHLVKRGVTEITLCGQNVNSWGLSMSEKFDIRTGSEQKLPFAHLLRKIHSIDEIKKISFLSSNPFDFTKDLIEALTLPKISDYIHIAVQSGNNEVLKKMNRRHTIEEFYKLASDIQKAKPNVEFGTDIIVGIPGETKEQFMDTVKLFDKINFNVAYIAMYSPRKGTPAERFYLDDVEREEKKWRHEYLTNFWRAKKSSKLLQKNGAY